MSRNPITTGRIGRTVYDIRHWKITLVVFLFVGIPTLVFRVLSGRNIFGGGRSTDARFFRRAVSVRKGWWNDLPGISRAALRLAVITGLWLWFVAPWLVITLASLELVVVGLSCWRRFRDKLHEKTVLRPVWPAVAGIIGIPESEPPSRWLDIPRQVEADVTEWEITVGLRAADAEDERRVRDLVTLFNQRYQGVPHYGWVDYAARLVHIRVRPPESPIWPAVANVLGVSSAALAKDWITVDPEAYGDKPGATVHVDLPPDAVNYAPFSSDLSRVVNQNFAGEWTSHVYRADFTKGARARARVVLTRKAPAPKPPAFVDFLAEHPDYRRQEAN
jgi:hypothetical protein